MSVELSVIMPMYFEENCIANSVARVTNVCVKMGVDYEILLVDDGSTDDTINIVRSLANNDPHIRMVVLASNHGKNLAITAGIAHASGRYILTMDPDLRDSPEEIERFYNKIKRGYDVVFSLRKARKDSLRDSMLSEWFWSLFQKYSGLAIPKNLGVIRIFRDEFASEFLRYSETFRFNEGIFFRIGMRRGFLEVIQTEGDEQPSKFTFAKKLQLAFMAITSHSNQPLTLPWYAAGFTFVVGVLAVIACFFATRFGLEIRFAEGLIIATAFLLASMQFMVLGVVAHYLGITVVESRRRPAFSVRNLVNFSSEEKLEERVGV